MQKNIEKLQQEMPFVFDLIAKLRADIAEATVDYHIEVDRLREITKGPDEFERAKRVAYQRLRNIRDPLHLELEVTTKRVADILAFMPMEPILYSPDRHSPMTPSTSSTT